MAPADTQPTPEVGSTHSIPAAHPREPSLFRPGWELWLQETQGWLADPAGATNYLHGPRRVASPPGRFPPLRSGDNNPAQINGKLTVYILLKCYYYPGVGLERAPPGLT